MAHCDADRSRDLMLTLPRRRQFAGANEQAPDFPLELRAASLRPGIPDRLYAGPRRGHKAIGRVAMAEALSRQLGRSLR